MASPQYVYVEPEDSFPSAFTCTVCHDVAGVHTACPGCSQTFCQSCVHRWFNTQKSNIQGCTCPYCRRKLKFSDLRHDTAVQQQLDQLMVYCPNKSAGCTAQLHRASVALHLSKECLMQQCNCRFCGIHGPRRSIQEHEEQSCSMRLVPCSNAAAGCSMDAPLLLVPMHLEFVCEYQCRTCPQCDETVARKDWSLHIQTACPAQQHCPLRLYGCSFSGTAEQLQQHQQHCSYMQQQQQFAQTSGELLATAAAAYPTIDPGELPNGCLVDEYSFFKAPTVPSSAAVAGQLLLDAVPAAALPPKLQPQPDRLSALAALEAQQRPAALAGQTAPKQFTTAGCSESSSGGSTEDSILAAGGMSPAEALAIGAPHCFRALGLDVPPEFEAAWRIAHNMHMIDVLSSEAGELPPPSSFMLYTTLIRSWETVMGIMGSDASVAKDSIGEAQAGSMLLQQEQQQPAAADTHSRSDSPDTHNSRREPAEEGTNSIDDVEDCVPGAERGLTESEFDSLNLWLIQQHKALSAVAVAVGCVSQLWISLGLLVLLPQAVELSQLAEAAHTAVDTLNTIGVAQQQQSSRPRKRPSASSGGESSSEGQQQQQRQQQSQQQVGTGATGPLEAAVEGGVSAEAQQQQQRSWFEQLQHSTSFMGLFSRSSLHSAHHHQQQHQSGSSAGSLPNAPQGLGIGLSSRQQQKQKQQDQQHQKEFAAATNSLDFTSAMQQLKSWDSDDLSKQGHIAPIFEALPSQLSTLFAVELCTAILVLHHLRAEHVETSAIPGMPPQIAPGCPGYWGVSILSVAEARLGPGFRIGWEGLAVLNDMVSGLVNRVLQVLGEGFYDVVEERVPLSPSLVMAAAQLLLPPCLLSSFLPALSVLSSHYHDEECEDLSEVTWQQLAARLGLKIELDKIVYVVDQRLPVTLDEDEDDDSADDDEDDDDDSDEDSVMDHEQQDNARRQHRRSIDASDSDSYMTDEEFEEQQQMRTRTPGSGRTRSAAGRADSRAAADGRSGVGNEESDGEDDGWESADSDEVMELLGEQEQQQQQQREEVSEDKVRDADVPAASEPAMNSSSSNGSGGNGPSGTIDIMESAPSIKDQQQQGTEACLDSDTAEAAMPMDWQHEFEVNLQQLANSSELSPLQQQLVCSAAHMLDWPQHDALQPSTILPGLAVQTKNLTPTSEPDQQQRQQQQSQEALLHSSNGVAAAADVTAGDVSQHHDPDTKEKDVGDATTHGVVLIAGLVEFVLTLLLKGASKAAAGDPAAVAAAANYVGNVPSTDAMQAAASNADHGAGQQQQRGSQSVLISARHVMLAAADDDDLRSIMIDSPIDQQHRNPAAAARSSVIPDFNMNLLPDPEKEPITAWLLELGTGRLYRQQQQQCGNSYAAIIHPADLRYYCGASRAYELDAANTSCSSTAADDFATAAGDPAANTVVCCWLAGWQCGACAAATAALQAQDLDKQVAAAMHSLQLCAAGASSSGSSAGAGLSNEQLEQLGQMTRMYHLQQPWWYEAQGCSSSCSQQQPCLSNVDLAQLTRLQQLLKPLQDVTAIREVYLQQQQDRRVWPLHDFREQVYDALERISAQRWQQDDMQRQLQRLVVKPSSIAAAAVAAGRSVAAAAAADESASDCDVEDMDFDDEAMMLLATAAEDFLVQQFRAANDLALHAGRQEVTPEDVRLALIQGGYNHMIPAASPKSGVGGEQKGRTAKSLRQLLKLS